MHSVQTGVNAEQGSTDGGGRWPRHGKVWYLIHLTVVHTQAYRPIFTMHCVTRPSFPSPAWQLRPSEVFIFHVQVICRAVNAPSHRGECGVTGQGVICKCCWKIYCGGWCGKVFPNRVRQEWWIWCLRPRLISVHQTVDSSSFHFLGGSSASNTPAYEWKPVSIAALGPDDGVTACARLWWSMMMMVVQEKQRSPSTNCSHTFTVTFVSPAAASCSPCLWDIREDSVWWL